MILVMFKVRLPVCNIDLAYTEEMWGELKDIKGDGHVKIITIVIIKIIKIICIIVIIDGPAKSSSS